MAIGSVLALPAAASIAGDDTPVLLTPKGEHETGADEQSFDKLRDAYYATRLLSGDQPLSLTQAAALRNSAGNQAAALKAAAPVVGGAWNTAGPSPIVQNGRTDNAFQAVSGRIAALAIRNDGTIILGAAQGGVWTYDAGSQIWSPRSNASDTQAVGALAIAPSNDNIVYMGSGEAALSGDSYYGDGFYRSTNGGMTWTHVSTLFTGQTVSDIVVDPANPQHVYAATSRGRGGLHRTTAPTGAQYGIYESTDGGSTWTLRKGTTDQFRSATDLVMDPMNPNVLFASFWGDGIYKSTDGGLTWALSMNGLPAGQFADGATRFSLGIADTTGTPVLYTGFDYFDLSDNYHQARIYKSTDGGDNWAATGITPIGSSRNSVLNYCGTQCFYDNEVKPDPTNPNVVYVEGSYGYNFSPQSNGIFRSKDGGNTWKSLGYNLHPDFHAIAFQPNDTQHVAIGNDGGVWDSHTGGGRNAAGVDPLASADWQNLNGAVNPSTGALVHSTGLTITQFSSIATVPTVPGQYWGGTQDNGTIRKSLANNRWFDQASGDGGQVLVDPNPNPINPSAASYVFGTYTGTAVYRYDPSEVSTFFGNEAIDGGIQPDRSEFYIPWVQNRGNVNQLFLGTYRVYRTNNAETANAADVNWTPISPDLTSGCTGTAPNGARGCLVSAVAVADGGDGVYAGTDEGWIWASPDAVTAASPSWSRVGVGMLPNRPVNQIATDRSNWRIAYAAYGGFAQATPTNTGHVFATKDGGKHWQDITHNLPDTPVNSIVLDPADEKTLYVGTDVGTFITTDGGGKWSVLGSGLPKVTVWQLDYDASHGVLLAGTHGRGAYTMTNTTARPALIVSKSDDGTPVGPGSTIHYTITVRNIGNAAATNVNVSDPVPANTKVVSIGQGGTGGNPVHWDHKTIPAGGVLTLTFDVQINPKFKGASIVNDGINVHADKGFGTTGSPHTTFIAPPHGLTVSPSSDVEGAKVGQSASFTVHVTNDGYKTDSFNVGTSGGSWSSATYDATCTTPMSVTPTVAAGATTDVCVKVDVPGGAADNDTNDTTFTATSAADAGVTGSSTLTTIAVGYDTLLVDNDTNDPVDSAPYYETALANAGVPYSYWDLAANPQVPESYLAAHKNIVWFTGNSYPAPIGPYETELGQFLDGGGRLLMSGQDILDQAAGRTAFVHDYLHIDWDGSEAQNDKATNDVHGVAGNPVSDGIGAVPLDHSVLNAAFEDQITPIAPATASFTDDSAEPDALTVATGGYKVVFLAFPLEAYGTASDKSDLMARTFNWFSTP